MLTFDLLDMMYDVYDFLGYGMFCQVTVNLNH